MALALETVGLEKRFGGLVATNKVSLKIERGARHALIGPNGAGKTTLINLLTGVLRPSAGRILLDGNDITRLKPHKRVELGITRTFQINQLFADLSPLETVALAVSERLGMGRDWWRLAGRSPEVIGEVTDIL
jgi:branched-chain amino acid transport system ATP-binding protein